jgi:hypothetical protein
VLGRLSTRRITGCCCCCCGGDSAAAAVTARRMMRRRTRSVDSLTLYVEFIEGYAGVITCAIMRVLITQSTGAHPIGSVDPIDRFIDCGGARVRVHRSGARAACEVSRQCALSAQFRFPLRTPHTTAPAASVRGLAARCNIYDIQYATYCVGVRSERTCHPPCHPPCADAPA